LKVIERVFEKSLRSFVKLDEIQMRFMPGKGTNDAIFIVRQITDMMKKYVMAGKISAWYLLTWKKLLIESQER